MNPGQIPYEPRVPLPEMLMQLLRLDKVYMKAKGNYLFYREGDETRRVTDFAGGYGSLLLGHNHPELTGYARELLRQSIPVHAQLSSRKKSGELGRVISDLIGHYTGKQYQVILTNTGAEAVEAAIKHLYLAYSCKISKAMESLTHSLNRLELTFSGGAACDPVFRDETSPWDYRSFRNNVIRLNQSILENHRPVILAAKNAFHGKTMGSLYVTYYSPLKKYCLPPEMQQQNFFKLNSEAIGEIIAGNRFSLYFPRQLKNGQIVAEEKALSSVAGIIIEPILGEGGIVCVPDEILRRIRELTSESNIPLVFDEIQCGMFRTGHFIASAESVVPADYYLLGKALGGGVAKISALAVEESKYDGRFRFIQTSTFAEDDFSSAIALKAVEISRQNAGRALKAGHHLFTALSGLAAKYPGVILEIRGKGCMDGITFRSLNHSRSGLLQSLSRSGFFGYMLSGYLLNRHNLRVAPTLSDPFTLRLEPSLFITPGNIRHLIRGLDELCRILQYEDVYSLVEYSLDADYQKLRGPQCFTGDPLQNEEVPHLKKVGFLTHYINTATIKECEPSLCLLPDKILEDWLWKFLPVSEPVLLDRQVMRDSGGKPVEIIFAGLGFTSKMARMALGSRNQEAFVNLIEKAVDMLYEEFEVDLTGLGQFTSILTHNGLLLKHPEMKFTTGNSYTVSIGIDSIISEIDKSRSQGHAIHAGIIGAAGNIASVYSKCIIRYIDELSLLGSESEAGFQRAEEVAKESLHHLVNALMEKNPDGRGILEDRIYSSRLFSNIRMTGVIPDQHVLWREYQAEFEESPPINVISSLDAVKSCNVVIVSTNQGEPFLETSQFNPGTLVYDISIPTNCTDELIHNNKGIRVIFGGIAELPGHEKIGVIGLPLEKGFAYGCISETLILGFENWGDHFSYGPISSQQVELIGKMARSHGFHHILPQTTSVKI